MFGAPALAFDPSHKTLDAVLDANVRDGLVYYRALTRGRAPLDGYVASLAGVSGGELSGWSREAQLAFWINAYNALVLEAALEHYPADRQSPRGLRHVPGVFDRVKHRVGGRVVTLDGIERQIIPALGDPRALFALSPASRGGPRLRSEAYQAERLDAQLADAAREYVRNFEHVHIEPDARIVRLSRLLERHAPDFTGAYATTQLYVGRGDAERALLNFIHGLVLLRSEREFLEANNFKMEYADVDGRLNDLTR